jgi:carbonic anhydrase
MIKNLLEQNRLWAEKTQKQNPGFFKELAKQQNPEYLWIGCSDSRVPSNQIIDMPPGEIFVHRNVANLVVHSDLNCLSVIQYAVYRLKVKDIIVCGHYGCGGVKSALEPNTHGLIDNWLFHIKKCLRNHSEELDLLEGNDKVNRMCELNVIEQVNNVCHTTVVQGAWLHGLDVSVHGWIYGLENGRIKDLKVSVSNNDELEAMEESFYRSSSVQK